MTIRTNYAQLRDRCLEEAPEQADYINALYASWDAELERIDGATLAYDAVVQDLSRVIAHPDLSTDALVEWLDAYPDAICDWAKRGGA